MQEAGGLLYQEPCVMVRDLHRVLGQATADGLQFCFAQGYFSCYVWKRAVTLVCYMRPCRTLFGKKPFLRLKKSH